MSVLVLIIICSMETITLGDKRIGIKTSVLEEKATACNMLCCYADELKEGFYPWIDQVDIENLVMFFIIEVFRVKVLLYIYVTGCPNFGTTS